ncbi:indole-3-glycerol phosphate synthase TrpC [soil metagenome]
MDGVNAVDVLDRIVATKREEITPLRAKSDELRARAVDMRPARDFREALTREGEVRLLAEIKRRSPSAGLIRAGVDAAEVARAYTAAGAAALSVLTDEKYFGGSLQALREARSAVEVPLLRKDFIIAREQVWEARIAGADAVLLIARILDDELLGDLHETARESGLAVLVEVHNLKELERAIAAGSEIVGVNNRDLSTFTTDLSLSLELASAVPDEVTLIAESGIRTASDVQALGSVGVDAVLVGESLMRQADLQKAAALLVGHAKRSRAR